MSFFLGLLIGLIPLWFYQRRYHSSLVTWKKRLHQEQHNYYTLDQKHRYLAQEHQRVKQEFIALQNTHQALIQDKDKLTPQQEELARQLEQLEQENQNLTQEHQRVKQELIALHNTHQALIQDKDKLTLKLQQLERENQKLKADCNYFEQCAIEAEEKNNFIQQENENIQTQIQEYQPYNQHPNSSFSPKDVNQNNECAYENQIIIYSHEANLYPNEIYEMIFNLIREELNRIPPEYKRRHHVLQSLLDCNFSEGNQTHIKQQIERLFSEYTGANKRLERELQDLGFQFFQGTNHHKIIWQNDSRYTFSFAKSPSDRRAGRNISRDLIHLLF